MGILVTVLGTATLIYLIIGAMFTSVFWTLLHLKHSDDDTASRKTVYVLLLVWPYMVWLMIKRIFKRGCFGSPKPPNRTKA